MLEDFITELDKPIRTCKLLIAFLEEYIEDNLCIDLHSNERERKSNILAILHGINLAQKDISKTREKYYQNLLKELYKSS